MHSCAHFTSNMKKFSIGIIAMAAKPPHAGHVALLELACNECDVVYAFVSTADRSRPGELEVKWEDVEQTWSEDTVPSLPNNFKYVPTREAPVRKAYELIESSDHSWKIALYGRPEDMSERFRLMPKNVTIRSVNLGAYSGTACRKAVADNDFSAFKKMMAPQVDAEALWTRLRKRIDTSVSKKRTKR